MVIPFTNKKIIDISVLMISAVIIWIIYFLTNFDGIPIGHSDAMNYGQIARNIVEGEGFTVNEIVPRKLVYVSEKSEYFKSIIAPPLHPMFISLFFLLFGISDTNLILSSALFFIFTVLLLYLLTNDLFNRKIALVVSGLYIINLQLLWYTLSGQTESLYIFLLVASFYAIYKSKEPWHFLIVGAILGLSWLTRINTIFFIIPFAIYAYYKLPEKRLLNVSLLLTGFIVVGFPLFYRNYHYFGDPILGWYGSAAAWGPEFNLQPLIKTSIIASVDNIFGQPIKFIAKYISNLTYYYDRFLKMSKPLIMSFFIVSLFRWSYDSRSVNKFKILFLVSLLLQLLVLCAYGTSSRIRYFHIFIPVIIIFATEAFFFIYEKFDVKHKTIKSLIYIVLIFFLVTPLINFTVFKDSYMSGTELDYSWIGKFITENTNEDEIIMSNVSSAVGWYGDRRSISIPFSFETVEAINEDYLQVDGILLCLQTDKAHDYLENFSQEWKYIYEKSPPNYRGYSLVKKFHIGNVKTVFYKKNI